MEADLPRDSTRRDVVRPAERGKEVVENVVVRKVDDRETGAPLVTVAVEEIVVSQGGLLGAGAGRNYSWRLRGRCAGNAESASRLEVRRGLFGKRESCDQDGRLNRRLCRGLRDRGVPDVANLAMLLVVGGGVPMGDRMRTQRTHPQDERDG